MFRTETDLLGAVQVPADSLYGVHTQRAVENFPLTGRPVRAPLIHAYGAVKLACARANHEMGRWTAPVFRAVEMACAEMMDGALDGHIVVDALQGGAGTSTNMNVNEVLANRALQIMGEAPGRYGILHPIDDINLHQSTNDTYPTALRVAAIRELRVLERKVVALLEAFQDKERDLASIVKVARTELQDATLTTLGRTMGAFAEPLARDRWRIYKCEERLRVVNLGGTAVGTGLGAPRRFIFRATDLLREITSIGLARAENLIDATQNLDPIIEVSGILRALASSLLKISSDLRLLSSGPSAGLGEIVLPSRQAGSSIMPGKVNPVIPEAASQAALMALAQDQALALACSLGNLELNQFMPLVADCFLGTIELLGNACEMLRRFCVEGIMADSARCLALAENSTASVTALVEEIGYENAVAVAERARERGETIRQSAVAIGYVTSERYDELVAPEAVTRLGSPMSGQVSPAAARASEGGER